MAMRLFFFSALLVLSSLLHRGEARAQDRLSPTDIAAQVYAQALKQVPARADSKPLYLSYEKRLLLTYFLAGAGESSEKQKELAERFQKILLQFVSLPAKVVTVRNFREFLTSYRGPWPESYSVETDLELLEKGQLRGPVTYRFLDSKGSPNPELERLVTAFVQDQNVRLMQKTGMQSAPLMAVVADAQGLLDKANEKMFETWIFKGFAKADELISKQVQILDQVGQQIASSGKLDGLKADQKLFIETLLRLYASRLSLRTKKQIVSSFLGENLNAESMKKFEILVANADPIFQKALQILAEGPGLSKDLNAIFEKLLSDVKPVPEVVARQIIEPEARKYQLRTVEYKNTKGGSMAQVHFGTRFTPQGPASVVIRFIRPEIDIRVQEGARIFTEIAPLMDRDPRFKNAGFPRMEPIMTDIIKSVVVELNQEQTKVDQMHGRKVYNREVRLKSPGYNTILQIYVPDLVTVAGETKLMVQERVAGQKLAKEILPYEKLAPGLQTAIMEAMGQVWIDEALFKSGYFHADMHPGNFLVEITDDAVRVNLMDFGMVGQISKETQTNFLLLVAGIELSKASVIAQTLWDLSEKSRNQIQMEPFKTMVTQRVAAMAQGRIPREDFQEWLIWSLNSGIRFPYEFGNLNRGVVILEKALSRVGSTLTVKEIARRAAIRNLWSVFNNIRAKGLLTKQDMIKLGWMGISDSEPTIPGLTAQKPASGGLTCSSVHLRK